MFSATNPLEADEKLFAASQTSPHTLTIRFKRHWLRQSAEIENVIGLIDYLNVLERNSEIKCILMLGNPEKRGSAEYVEWQEWASSEEGKAQHASVRMLSVFQQLVRRILKLPQIVLFGDGGRMTMSYLSLGLAADYCVLGTTSVVENPNLRFKTIPVGGVVYFLKERLGHQKSFELLSQPEPVSSRQLLDLGLCHSVCPAGEVEAQLKQQADYYLDQNINYLRALKGALHPDWDALDHWFYWESNHIS
ncbi:enoyl-CoA hydratase-related protein [Coraliomargarita parva]|uniref:enoyl-CoA hydratase-related protein n=1 Tax=Coraliomargarita parva TaxID=3014050 RepID=UPI0022B3C5C2|nr:enoyl-CoA hydratase-related protein [Coraliomargarita parva]